MRASILLLPAFAALAPPASAQASESYHSIELRGGGTVTVRYGPTRRVMVRESNPNRPIRSEGKRLVIDRCNRPCPRGHRIHVEVVTPEIVALGVTDGGILQVQGFPRQSAITAAVSSGGTIDMRSLEAGDVTAAVSQGGRILARPRATLTAAISDGGNITYWGDPTVTTSVRRGGAVGRGSVAELNAPLARVDPPLPRLVPPTPPRPPRNH